MTAIHVNAHALARYAALCQATQLVPIVKPEVLMDGDHNIDRCYEATQRVLDTTFQELRIQSVRRSEAPVISIGFGQALT